MLRGPLSGELLRNTVELTVRSSLATAVIGTAAAWFVVRTDLPGARSGARSSCSRSRSRTSSSATPGTRCSPGFIGLRAAAHRDDARPLSAGLPARSPRHCGEPIRRLEESAARARLRRRGRRSGASCSRRSARLCSAGCSSSPWRCSRSSAPSRSSTSAPSPPRSSPSCGSTPLPRRRWRCCWSALGIVVLVGEVTGAGTAAGRAARGPQASRAPDRQRLGLAVAAGAARPAGPRGRRGRRTGRHARLLADALADHHPAGEHDAARGHAGDGPVRRRGGACSRRRWPLPVALLAAQRRGPDRPGRSRAAPSWCSRCPAS